MLDREWRPRSSASPQVEHSRWKLNLECRPFPGFAVHGCRLAWLGFAWLQELPFGFSNSPYLHSLESDLKRTQHWNLADVRAPLCRLAPRHRDLHSNTRPSRWRTWQHAHQSNAAQPTCPKPHLHAPNTTTHISVTKLHGLILCFFIRQRMFCFGAPFTTTTARLHNRLSATNTVMSPSQVSARKGARSTRCHTGASARRRMQRRQDDLALCNYGFIRLRWHTNLQVFAAHVGNSLSDAPARRARCVTKSTAAIGCEA